MQNFLRLHFHRSFKLKTLFEGEDSFFMPFGNLENRLLESLENLVLSFAISTFQKVTRKIITAKSRRLKPKNGLPLVMLISKKEKAINSRSWSKLTQKHKKSEIQRNLIHVSCIHSSSYLQVLDEFTRNWNFTKSFNQKMFCEDSHTFKKAKLPSKKTKKYIFRKRHFYWSGETISCDHQ